MGLDMYLSRSVYISNYEHDPKEQKLAKAVMDALDIKDQATYANGGITVRLPAAYWRKANAIHGWFVNNCQDGVDDCRESYVSTEQLTQLRDLCRDILAGTKTKDDMQPTAGFFFGNTDNDEWYRADLADTVEKLDKLFATPPIGKYGDEFYYRSSW